MSNTSTLALSSYKDDLTECGQPLKRVAISSLLKCFFFLLAPEQSKVEFIKKTIRT